MAQNGISLAAARGNFLTWCISGYLPLQELCRPLFIGQQLDGADGVPGEYYILYSTNEARAKFGTGSILAWMAKQHFDCCPELPLYASPVADPTTGAAAAFNTITIAGPATDNGALSSSTLTDIFAVAVTPGATADNMAAGLAAQLQKNADLPFTVTVATNVITLTAKNKGPAGNWFSPIWNPNFGDFFPEGVTVTTAQTTPGTGVLDIDAAIPAMACPWDCIALGTEDEIAVNTFVLLVRQNWRCGVQAISRTGICSIAAPTAPGRLPRMGATATIRRNASSRSGPATSIPAISWLLQPLRAYVAGHARIHRARSSTTTASFACCTIRGSAPPFGRRKKNGRSTTPGF